MSASDMLSTSASACCLASSTGSSAAAGMPLAAAARCFRLQAKHVANDIAGQALQRGIIEQQRRD